MYYDELLKSNFMGATGNISVNTTAARRQGYLISLYKLYIYKILHYFIVI